MDAGAASGSTPQARRRKNNRAGRKKKKTRRKSFAAMQDGDTTQDELATASAGFYSHHSGNLSNTSLDSEALLDHRDQQPLRPRRPSIAVAGVSSSSSNPFQSQPHQYGSGSSRLRTVHAGDSAEEDDESTNEGAPLLSQSQRLTASESATFSLYGSNDTSRSVPRSGGGSSMSGDKKKYLNPFSASDNYNVNYPPSVPGSPRIRPADTINFGDDLLRDEISMGDGLLDRMESRGDDDDPPVLVPSPLDRRHTVCMAPEEDVCFPQEGMSEMGDDELHPSEGTTGPRTRARRRRTSKWPDLAILDEWSHLEKEGRNEERRVKRITEPQLINGRLRPVNKTWFRAEDDAPYRFTYFNEEFQSTIHSQTISELVQPGGSFRELFVPDPPVLEESASEEDEDYDEATTIRQSFPGWNGDSRAPSRQTQISAAAPPSLVSAHEGYAADQRPAQRTLSPTNGRDGHAAGLEHLAQQTIQHPGQQTSLHSSQHSSHQMSRQHSQQDSGNGAPAAPKSPTSALKSPTPPEIPPTLPEGKLVRYGERPVWWLDILSPTEAEMRVLSKAFGIHPLTAEDIIMQEAREKVELFRHYYFVNYRTFDQDQTSENFLEPVNMYVVVFREGILSFHFSITPHPANVRRRVRQLRDYMILSADWISYAIIDDITDVFVPLIQRIEEEVDEIDDAVLELHSSSDHHGGKDHAKNSAKDSAMLRRIGDCRKKVMSLYRLLGNKADVIKGFAKRCNEHWEVAPRSDIGLYLGDIQDHIVTMTGNLSHYEKMLARSHANYLAQINLRMNERQEETADILGKLTILGTIVLPMNLVTGLWGMNVWVPGQEMEGDLRWFFWITSCLITCGLLCFWVVKRMYGL